MRDYDPTTGRYLETDPLGLVDGASVYGYALQNPGRLVDPRGQSVGEVVIGSVIGGVEWGGAVIGGGIVGVLGILLYPSTLGDGTLPDTRPISTLDPELDRTYPFPPPPKKGWRCTCRADANQNIVGNCGNFAFGTADGPDLTSTKKTAKRIAIANLGQQPKHVGCKCVGPGGRKVSP
jgi:uncharacterized protein RhaS with RHS repeats